MQGPRLVCHGIYKRYGRRTILRNVEFSLNAGELAVLTGANGVGKTTLLHIVSGLLLPDAGDVRVDGANAKSQVGQICFLPDDLRLWPHLSGLVNLRMISELSGCSMTDNDASHVLDAVGLGSVHHSAFGNYSLGERRRLGLAMAVVRQPPVLLADEPTVGLDDSGRAVLLQCVRNLQATGTVILVSSHDPAAFDRHPHHQLEMVGGTVSA